MVCFYLDHSSSQLVVVFSKQFDTIACILIHKFAIIVVYLT
jgi:hypothetical protein